jgi:DNA-binding transcriptional MocR family regulator
MVKIQPFLVEEYMNRVENTPGVLNVAETCSASISLEDLTQLCKDPNTPGPLHLSRKLTYGDILGSDKLRSHIAKLLSRDSATPLPAENVIVTQGAIAGNYLVFYSLVGPGDHVVCVYPTYQQLYSVAESLGAEVSLWKLREENGYVPDVSALEGLVRSNTKVRPSQPE